MTLVSSTIPNLVNGVSQQPDALRLTSQCELLENGYATVVKGVRKRPPFRHLAQLFNTAGYDSAYLHTINRDAIERYTVVVTNGDLKVFAQDGTPRTVTFPSGKAYLNATTPASAFAALTVADYTFIANKNVLAAMDNTSTNPARPHEAMIFVRQGAYSSNYFVYINGTQVASYTTSAATASDIATDNITLQLYDQLAAAGFNAGNWTLGFFGSVLYLSNSVSDFTISTRDSIGDKALLSYKDKVQNFSTLPAKAVTGFTILVSGDASTAFDNYWVKYVDASGGSNGGVWVECPAPGVLLKFDATTLPWKLVRNSDGTFTFDKVAWNPRPVGDNTSAPVPSFIGRTINDIFFHRNRLGFISGENIIFSKAGQFFDFWPDTITAVLDSDRIDIAVNHTKVSTLRAAIPYNEDLTLFSDQTQFLLSGGDILTPKNVTVKPQTEFENNSVTCKPIQTGKTIYFGVNRGSFTAIREFGVLPNNSNQRDAPEVTSHVPQYIPPNVFKIAASSNESVLAVLTSSERNAVYIYKYYWNGDQKLQSSWSKWVLDAGDVILNVDFIQTDLYAVIQRSDGVYLEVLSIELGRTDLGFPFQVNLDRRLYLTGSYNSVTNQTTWTLPFQMTGGAYQVVLGPAFTSPAQVGTVPNVTAATTTTLVALGNYSAGPCYIGRQYTKRYRFSKQFVRDRSPNGSQQANTEGRLQLNRFGITFEQTGYFRAEVTAYARPMAAYQFTGYLTGDSSDVIGGRPTPSGVFKFPVLSDASTVTVDLVNDTYLPSSFQQAGWEAKYYIRSGRI